MVISEQFTKEQKQLAKTQLENKPPNPIMPKMKCTNTGV